MKLNPCPFCGESEDLLLQTLDAHTPDPTEIVGCDACGTFGPPCEDATIARELWNRRAMPKPMDGTPAGDEIAVLRITLSKLRDAADRHEWIDQSERTGGALAQALNDAGEILDAEAGGSDA